MGCSRLGTNNAIQHTTCVMYYKDADFTQYNALLYRTTIVVNIFKVYYMQGNAVKMCGNCWSGTLVVGAIRNVCEHEGNSLSKQPLSAADP